MKRGPFLLLILCLPVAAWAAKTPVIESIQGDQAVVVITMDQQRFVSAGTPIQYWDKVVTSPRAAAKIRYPDGSVLIVGRDTKIEIQPHENGTQYNQLSYGEVRAQVVKGEKTEKPKPSDPPPKPRFVIRTKTAVMGVRGTDFVAAVSSVTNQASLHTLEGVVDFGSGEQAVMSGQGTPVSAGQMVSFDPQVPSSAPPVVKEFSAPTYEKDLIQQQPELLALADPPRPSESSEKNLDDDKEIEKAKAQSEANTPPRFRLLRFGLGGVFLNQKLSSTSYVPGPQGPDTGAAQLTTFELAWTPSMRVFGPFTLRGNVSVFPLKEKNSGEKLAGMQIGLLLSLTFLDPIIIEAGVGGEKWGPDSPGGPFMRGNVAYQLDGNHWIERIYAGVSLFGDATNIKTDIIEIHGGLGFQL